MVLNIIIYFRHHQHDHWQARIGRVAGDKDLYLGIVSPVQSLVQIIKVIQH